MKRLLIICLACTVFNTACSQNISQKYPKKSTSKKETLNVDTSKIAIFKLDDDGWLVKRYGIAKSFSLTDDDLKYIDEVFNKCIAKINIDTAHIYYKRQYVPYIDKDGHKKVWVNCFCFDSNDDFPHWKNSIVLVDDGGSCFFNVTIDLSDNSFSNLEVNGEA